MGNGAPAFDQPLGFVIVDGRDGHARAVAPDLQLLDCRGRPGGDRAQRVVGRERVVVAHHATDVVVAAHHPVVDEVAVELDELLVVDVGVDERRFEIRALGVLAQGRRQSAREPRDLARVNGQHTAQVGRPVHIGAS